MTDKKKTGSKSGHKKDPHAQREASRYDQPIASRELILDVIAEADRPLKMDELRGLLDIRGDEAEEA
ncbi:MAG: hypothetical protein KJO10_06865, partial [Gammaproteobacteria bacterium]|nr:hypothetical protein [Gammaproteobacteria bacterium]